MEKTQKNYYLNEQMRAIRKEMGAEEEAADELQELEKRIKRKRLPREAAGKVRQVHPLERTPRALAGIANRTVIFCVPGSTGACRTAWGKIIQSQLDSRHTPCNFVGALKLV